MKTQARVILLGLSIAGLFGAWAEVMQKDIEGLIDGADRAGASGDAAGAEKGYKEAIKKCDQLPPAQYHCKTDVLRKLGNLYAQMMDAPRAEATFKQRLAILEAHHKDGERPDLDLGIALFDLQITLGGANLANTKRDADEQDYANRARTFYQQCKANFADLRATCDRRLADIEGFQGAFFFLKDRLDEATPLLKAVVDRPDSGVRKEVLALALEGYAKVLLRRGRATDAEPVLQRLQRLNSQK